MKNWPKKVKFTELFAKITLKYREINEEIQELEPFTSIIGGAGVTSGEKQLTSGSGVAIYQGFTQETSQLVKKSKNYSHLQAI